MTQKGFLPGASSHAITIKRAMKNESLSSILLVRRGLSGKVHTICYIGWPNSKYVSVVKKKLAQVYLVQEIMTWFVYTNQISKRC